MSVLKPAPASVLRGRRLLLCEQCRGAKSSQRAAKENRFHGKKPHASLVAGSVPIYKLLIIQNLIFLILGGGEPVVALFNHPAAGETT